VKDIKPFRLEGSSMLPLFRSGDIALVEPLPPSPSSSFILSPGDCVVYRHAGGLFLHRVLSADENGLLISDDAGLIAAHRVPREEVVGRVVTTNPLKKGFAGFAYSKLRRLLFSCRQKA